MKSIISVTYYQIMYAMALSLTFEEKPNLYVNINYSKISEDVIDRLGKCGLFSCVRTIDIKEMQVPLSKVLKKPKDISAEEVENIGDSLFREFIDSYCTKIFNNADLNEEIYLHSDLQWYYYYVEKSFKKIIGIEDGYKSIEQQLSTHRFKDDIIGRVEPFIPKYFPDILYKSPKISKIISSVEVDNADPIYKEKLKILDFFELINKNREKCVKAILQVFDIMDFQIKSPNTLYLTQPLDRANYCDSFSQYLVSKKMIENETKGNNQLYIKPHPAENLNYDVFERNNVTIINKDAPVEVLNCNKNITFDKATTIGSTAINTIHNIKEKEFLLEGIELEPKNITRLIKSFYTGTCIDFDVYIKLVSFEPEDYINIYAFAKNQSRINIKITVLTNDVKKANEFLNKKNAKAIIQNYEKFEENPRKLELFKAERRELVNNIQNREINILEFSGNIEKQAVTIVEKNSLKSDYIMFTNSKTLGFGTIKSIIVGFKKKMPYALTFPQHTITPMGNRITLGLIDINDNPNTKIENKLLHRRFFDILDKEGDTKLRRARLLWKYRDMNVINPKKDLPIIYSDYLESTFSPTEIIENIKIQINEIDKIKIKDKKEFKRSFIAVELYEYINSLKTRKENPKVKLESEEIDYFLDNCGIRQDEKEKIQSDLIAALFVDINRERKRKTYVYTDYYNYIEKLYKD